MKKYIGLLLAAVLLLALAGCAGETTNDVANRDQTQAEASGMTIHKIGVATYNIKDAQIMMFKDYLDNYIKECFSDVTFLYSDSISGIDDMLDFLSQCADNGAEGVMIFGSADLVREVEFCAEHEMYVIRPSGTSSDAVFDAVADNPYFVGEIGPGAENEYNAAADMTRAVAGDGKSYVILSSGASAGNEMHRLRTTEAEQYSFYRVPKTLLTAPRYKSVSIEASEDNRLFRIIPATINPMPRNPNASGTLSFNRRIPPSKVKITSPHCVASTTAS